MVPLTSGNFYPCQVFDNSFLKFCRFEAARADCSRINYSSIQPDEIETGRVGSIRLVDGITHLVHVSRNLVLQISLAAVGERASLLNCFRVIHCWCRGLWQPPPIQGVSFSNIDIEELYAVVIAHIEVVETDRPLDVRRSGIAAEDERYRLLAAKVREANGVLAVDVIQLEIRGNIPLFGGKSI